MTGFRHIKYSLPVLLLLAATPCAADINDNGPPKITQEAATTEKLNSEHIDPIEIDSALTLPQLVDLTLEKYPDRLINEALAQEAEALHVRGDSWFAGSNALSLDYSGDQITGNRGFNESSAKLEFTVWNW